jgi:aerobic-type carbon monoxide dehydrogenase small subunit (CoxS/CutS family)
LQRFEEPRSRKSSAANRNTPPAASLEGLPSIAGKAVFTVEALKSADGTLHPVQESFRENHALQCGYCTPGMVMAIVSLLDEEPELDERRVREGLEGNLCRCTGYHNIVKAVLACAADRGTLVQS